ncbi:hypothetical protein [Niallia sp. MER TA 168]|uniref:hypothetical protein n=1 Tax=Niallia sp. MER TA 168 TaxID=2939568 RepID=UPI0020402E51|nr:hypothetical protein [Niallia sp. MER TA 168]MCM3365085.1 hypothetical protein [Niallia sp. MER TA 168]
MRKLAKTSIVTLASIFLLSVPNVSATQLTSEYKDNDEGAIDSHLNDYGGKWIYEKSSSSYRGDHRFNPTSSGWYTWKTTKGKGYYYKALLVHLRNAKFTNPNAQYNIGNDQDDYIYGKKNQNTAPNGWSRVVDTYGYGSKAFGDFILFPNGYKNTGADGIKVEYYDKKPSILSSSKVDKFNYEEIKPSDSPALTLNSKSISKENIHYKMLNSIDYFKTAIGNFDYTSNSGGYKYTVDFSVDVENPKSHVVVKAGDKIVEESIYNGDGKYVDLNTKDKTYSTAGAPDKNEAKALKENNLFEGVSPTVRYSNDINGERVYDMRYDPTLMGMAQTSLFSQDIALGFLENYSKWNIETKEENNGYEAIVLSGELSDYYKNKHNAETFKLWVHSGTGILLKMEEYNKSGQVTESLITNSIQIDAPIEKVEFNTATPKNFVKTKMLK